MKDLDWRPIATKLRRDVLDPIKLRLVGKDEIIEVLGVSLVAGENTFLYGPPGTAKSALVQELASRLGGRAFDYLLTRFTEPSELFGPFDLRRLREGELVTNTEGMLPEAEFVFLDELLNANSAVLNSLLLALNERIFRRGRERVRLPMLLTIGASNRLPEDDALAALFDRFLLRVHCGNVPTERLSEVLQAGWQRERSGTLAPSLSMDEVRALQQTVSEVDLIPVRPAYIRLVERLREAGMAISDRRVVRLQRVVAGSAVISGRDHAAVSDLWTLRYIWDVPAQREMLAAHVQVIVTDFSAKNEPENVANIHPLADSEQGPHPEQIALALDNISAQPNEPAVADQLALLAARVESVKNIDSREYLRLRIAGMRGH